MITFWRMKHIFPNKYKMMIMLRSLIRYFVITGKLKRKYFFSNYKKTNIIGLPSHSDGKDIKPAKESLLQVCGPAAKEWKN